MTVCKAACGVCVRPVPVPETQPNPVTRRFYTIVTPLLALLSVFTSVTFLEAKLLCYLKAFRVMQWQKRHDSGVSWHTICSRLLCLSQNNYPPSNRTDTADGISCMQTSTRHEHLSEARTQMDSCWKSKLCSICYTHTHTHTESDSQHNCLSDHGWASMISMWERLTIMQQVRVAVCCRGSLQVDSASLLIQLNVISKHPPRSSTVQAKGKMAKCAVRGKCSQVDRHRQGLRIEGKRRKLKINKQEITPINTHLPLIVALLSSLPPLCVRVVM